MNESKKDLIVIDGGIANAGTIAKAVSEEQEILLLSENNGLEEVKAYLAAKCETYDSIHFITHGRDGAISINGESISSENLKAEDWAVIGSYLTDDGDLLFYGCEIAKSAEGKWLINAIAAAADADAAASINLTGKDGDWELEYVSGDVENRTITVAGYDGNLDNTTYNNKIFDNNGVNAYGGDVFNNCVFKNKAAAKHTCALAAHKGSDYGGGRNKPIKINSGTFKNNVQAVYRDYYGVQLCVNDTLFEYNSTYSTDDKHGQIGEYKGAAINSYGEIRYTKTYGLFDYRGSTEINNSTFRYNVAGTAYAIDENADWQTWSQNVINYHITGSKTIPSDETYGGYVDHRGCGGAILAYLNVHQDSYNVPESYK